MKNAIVLLVNNLFNFEAFCRNVPDSLQAMQFIFVNEDRIGDKTTDINIIASKYIKNFKIIKGSIIVNKFKQDILNVEFVDKYTMGLNILIQWYLIKYLQYDKILFLDDDIIITDKVFDIFNNLYECAYLNFRLSAGKLTYETNSKNELKSFLAFANIFDIDLNPNNYFDIVVKTHVNGGQRLYCKSNFNINMYEYYLKRFYNNTDIQYLWDKKRGPCTFYLDERFESFYALKMNIINNYLKDYCYIEIRNINKVDKLNNYSKIKNNAVWHNATCTRKTDWINKLQALNIIK